jgi:kumamolisin
MRINSLKPTLSSLWNHTYLTRVIGLCLFVVVPLLASCATTTTLDFVPIDLGIPAQALQSPIVGPLPDSTKLHVAITFKVNQDIINTLNDQRIHPGQHPELEQFANKIGIDDATYQKIKDFFNLKGIALNLSKLRTHLTIDAKASTFAKLFQTHFVEHRYNGRTFFAPATLPKLPRFLADSILAITGLDNYSSAPQHALTQHFDVKNSKKIPGQDCYPLNGTLLPKEIAHAYGYDQLWNHGWHGENMTVNLIEIDGYYQDDIQNYFNCINFQGNLNVVNVDGQPTQALGETALDIEMIAGLARSVNIVDYQTDGNADGDTWVQVNDELQQILNDNTRNANAGSIVSISLGAAEGELTSGDRNAIDQSLQLLTKVEHMRIFVASGDCGAFSDRIFNSLSVSFPASDPWATSVGGTSLSIDSQQHRAGEVVWSSGSNPQSCKNRWGSGGGNSQVYQHPSWQNANGVYNRFSNGNHREIPDVSASAYALAVYFDGQWGAVGGTSAAAPIWAAGLALVNQGLMRQIGKFTASPQLFYVVAQNTNGMQPFYDVTRGNNLYYPATPGWDYTSGLGTPNLWDFYMVLCNTLMANRI